MPRPKNQFVCGKCKGEFESYLDKQFLCPACRKKINPDTHCFNCGRKWKITNPGTREEDRQCGKCGMRMSPNLLIDIFSIERKK
jgi:DNA-directed RNA polymerase subunit RPC12/RpoP